MSEQSSTEPTMEEILASIRRIISEDEAPAADAGPAIPVSEPVPEKRQQDYDSSSDSRAKIEASSERSSSGSMESPFNSGNYVPGLEKDEDTDDDLELTQKVETHGDLDVLAPVEPDPEPIPPPPAEPVHTLVSDQVAAQAAATFGRLSQNIFMPAEGRTLEDVVREMLNPLLKDWLDTYLPDIVQTAVQAEVERIARGRVR